MSQLLQTIAQQLGPAALGQMSQQLGAEPNQLNQAISVALPALIGGLSKNAQEPQGAASLFGALMEDHVKDIQQPQSSGLLGGIMSALGGQSGQGAGLESVLGLAMGMMGQQGNQQALPTALNGTGILGHIFGARQQNVEQGVARASGLDSSIVMKLLPMLAPLVMRALASKTQEQNLNAGSLGQFLSSEQNAIEQQAPNQLSGLSAFLDQDGDGSVSDELLAMGSQLLSSGALSSLFK